MQLLNKVKRTNESEAGRTVPGSWQVLSDLTSLCCLQMPPAPAFETQDWHYSISELQLSASSQCHCGILPYNVSEKAEENLAI